MFRVKPEASLQGLEKIRRLEFQAEGPMREIPVGLDLGPRHPCRDQSLADLAKSIASWRQLARGLT